MRTLSLFSLPHIRDGRKMQKVIYLIIYTRAWGARIYFKRMFSTVPCVLKCLRFINGSVNKRVVSLFSPRGKAEPPFWPFCIFPWSGYCSRPHITTCPCVWKKVSVSVALRDDRNSANLCLTPFRVCETDCSEERNSGKKIVENPQEGKTHVKNGWCYKKFTWKAEKMKIFYWQAYIIYVIITCMAKMQKVRWPRRLLKFTPVKVTENSARALSKTLDGIPNLVDVMRLRVFALQTALITLAAGKRPIRRFTTRQVLWFGIGLPCPGFFCANAKNT